MLEYCQLDPWEHTFKQMHLKMSPAKSRPSFLDLSALTAAVASDSFDPAVHYVNLTHWPKWQCFFTHPLVPECPKNIKSLFNRKQFAFYVAYSDKTINLNLVHHHEPNGSTKGKLSNRNQRDKYLSLLVPRDLYTGSCLVECIAVYSCFVSYVTFLLFFSFFQCNSQELKRLEILRLFRNCSAQLIRLHILSNHDKWSVSTCFIIYFEYGEWSHSKRRSLLKYDWHRKWSQSYNVKFCRLRRRNNELLWITIHRHVWYWISLSEQPEWICSTQS